MNKIIFKSALITIASLVLSALIAFGLWILISPQTMADACEKTGNYSLAVTCADMRYSRTKDAHDLLRCVEDSILSGKDNLIVKYGEQLVKSPEVFQQLCEEKDGVIADSQYAKYTSNYRVYICGWLSAAQYREGNLVSAIATANSCLTSGSYNRLVIAVIDRGNTEAAKKVIEALEEGIEVADKFTGDEDLKNAEGLINLLEEFIKTRN